MCFNGFELVYTDGDFCPLVAHNYCLKLFRLGASMGGACVF